MELSKTRDFSIDIIKAIGIFFMVAGHAAFPLTHFIYLFHMAIFFIASGYFYKESNSADFSSVLRFIKRKMASLWIVYVLWTSIFSILHNFFIKINVYTDVNGLSANNIKITEYWTVKEIIKNILKSLFLRGGTELGSAFWFIVILMEISVGYVVIDYLLHIALKKQQQEKIWIIQSLISIVFLMIGYVCYLKGTDLFKFSRVFSYYCLFHGGFIIKKFNLSNRKRKDSMHFLILLVSFIILLFCNQIGSIELVDNYYVNPVFFIATSFLGWSLLYEISYFIQKSDHVTRFMVCVGQNTLSVVLLHFLCFKIVNYIGVLIIHKPVYMVAAFPILFYKGIWWVAYTFVGLAIPILLSIVWKKCEENMKIKVKPLFGYSR